MSLLHVALVCTAHVFVAATCCSDMLQEGDIGLCGIAVFDTFSWAISVIISIPVFSEPAGCGFVTFWTILKIISQVRQRFPMPFPVSR